MDATRVTISKETMEANKLNRHSKHARLLKEESVKALVRNTPAGEGLTLRHLMAAAGYNPKTDYQAGMQFVYGCVKRGVIKRSDPSEITFKKTYFVPEDAKTSRPAETFTLKSTDEPKVEEKPKGLIGNVEVLYKVEDIVHNAKQFAWEHNSDSLREFIASLQ